jgi:hypothetical protein
MLDLTAIRGDRMRMWGMIIPIPNLPLIFFILGVVYGILHPGREDRIGMLKKAIGIGFILGLIFGSLIAIFLPGVLSLFAVGVTIIAFVMLVLMIAVPFIIGTIVGDLIESIFR